MKPSSEHVTCQSTRAIGYDPGAVVVRGRKLLPLVLPSVLALTIAASLLINSTAVPDDAVGRLVGLGGSLRPPVDNQRHLYVLDGWGGLHPVGSSPALSVSATWPTKDIAYSLALFPDGTGGYVMDGWGGLHPVGSAHPVDSGVYWPHWIGAREVVMAPWSTSASPAG